MAKASPEDTDIQFALGSLYLSTGGYDQARLHFTNVLQRDPQYIDALLEIARVEIKAGNASKGLEYLNRAYSLATQRDNQEETAASLQVNGSCLRSPKQASGGSGKFPEVVSPSSGPWASDVEWRRV